MNLFFFSRRRNGSSVIVRRYRRTPPVHLHKVVGHKLDGRGRLAHASVAHHAQLPRPSDHFRKNASRGKKESRKKRREKEARGARAPPTLTWELMIVVEDPLLEFKECQLGSRAWFCLAKHFCFAPKHFCFPVPGVKLEKRDGAQGCTLTMATEYKLVRDDSASPRSCVLCSKTHENGPF